MVIDPDRRPRLETVAVGDQEAVAFGQDGGGGAPSASEPIGHPDDREVLHDQAFQRPAQSEEGDLRAWLGRRSGVPAPPTRATGCTASDASGLRHGTEVRCREKLG